MDKMEVITCTAPVNLAVIKYWGKRDEELILPVNSSLSATLSQEELCVTTSVAISSKFSTDRIWLNGRENFIKDYPRLQNVLKIVREEYKKTGKTELMNSKVHICSVNNFPTAAGLASSAAGFACLAFALTKLFKIECDVSVIARQGSGSACRSIYGGFVAWEKGEKSDGTDSIAVQVAPENHWTEMHILVLVVSEEKKETSSTSGMRRSVETSELLKLRAEHVVPQRMYEMKQAILNKDFEKFADLTMKDSNQFHAICLDTFPPIIPPYMNSISHSIIQLISKYNELCGTKVAYSFDAGPSAVLFLREKDVPECLSLIKTFFPPTQEQGESFLRGLYVNLSPDSDTFHGIKEKIALPLTPGGIKYIIHTQVGDGPRIVKNQECCLLNAEGLPKKSSDN
ncbi:diphosphomevalonate decarboxylase-like [Xenia sp. Carnegie-2017]|uniref:diphosphomevalonate decarboxylase-like n=1 Tax=Xenia sp. Carnegie-2017 TaxID=2897299 RepID=UPI001F041F4B|nr:diphosphomevalonate decarboxylase-like [Xenia sp. Carnegie-2017]